MSKTTNIVSQAEQAQNTPTADQDTTSPAVTNTETMNDAKSPQANPSQPEKPMTYNPTSRWWASVCFGVVFSVPFAWLLSYAAALPFFIGMFFFVLFGLVIGAAVFRLASKNAPYRTKPLVIGTTVIVLFIWSFTIIKESHDFPHDTAIQIANKTRDIGDQPVQEFHAGVAEQVKQFLRTEYAPGGTLGYMRWVLTDGVLVKDDFDAIKQTISAPQIKMWWAVRVTLTVLLLAFGIGSQTLTLKKPFNPSKRLVI